MTTYSRIDLATRFMKDLGLLAADEVLTAEDYDYAIETVSAEVALLSAIDMPIWNGSDLSVPIEYLTALSRRIGLAASPSFGLMTVAQAEQAMPLTEVNLRRLAQKPPTGETQQAEYF